MSFLASLLIDRVERDHHQSDATANPMLVFAALLLGFVLALQRRASGGILAPILTHITWSATMLFALPALIHR